MGAIRYQKTQRAGGFTLVETMFALVIFAIGALAALNMATEQLRSTSILETRYFAQQVASNRMAEVHLEARNQTVWPPVDEFNGEMEMAGVQWFWEQQVLETVTPDLREVTIRVRDTAEGQVVVELSSYVGRR